MTLVIQILGYFLVGTSLLSMIPQGIKVYKSEKTKGISIANYILKNIRIISFLILNAITAELPKSLPNILPTMISSLFIAFLFFYMFKDNKKYFYIALILILSTLITSIILLASFKTKTPTYVKYIFTFAGLAATIIGLVFQAKKTWKLKNVKNLSIKSVAIDTASNSLWMVYWILSFFTLDVSTNSTIAAIRATASLIVAIITSIPLWIHLYFNRNIKNKNYKFNF